MFEELAKACLPEEKYSVFEKTENSSALKTKMHGLGIAEAIQGRASVKAKRYNASLGEWLSNSSSHIPISEIGSMRQFIT